MIYSRYEPSAAVPNVVSIPAADVPAITLKTSGNRTVTALFGSPEIADAAAARIGSAGILGLRELARAKSVSNRNIVVVMGDLNSEHRPPELPRVAQVRIQGRKSDSSRRPESHLPALAQVAAHRAGSRAVHSGLKPSGVKSFGCRGH